MDKSARIPTIAEMRKALEASTSAMTPLEHFRRMVASGVINARGEVTRLIGGDAEPEPGARRPNLALSLTAARSVSWSNSG